MLRTPDTRFTANTDHKEQTPLLMRLGTWTVAVLCIALALCMVDRIEPTP